MNDAPRVPGATAPELKAQIEAEREGRPFLVYRDGEGEQRIVPIAAGATELWVGRSGSADIRIDWDEEVSGLHAQIEVVARRVHAGRRRPLPQRLLRQRRARPRAAATCATRT